MKLKYLTNFMMFTDLLIEHNWLLLLPATAILVSVLASLYSHFKNIFLRLYVIAVTLVEDITAIRLANKKNAGSTKAALKTMCTNYSMRVVKCTTCMRSVQWIMDLWFCIITCKGIDLLYFVRFITENSVCT
jgi:hypothetical protein